MISRPSSGEKPYECSNCKKRFSHSGSYSSHISSKKCVSAANPNFLSRVTIKASAPTATSAAVTITPTRIALKEKPESKPLQEQLPVTQIKSEPVEYPCKPVMAAPATVSINRVVNGGTSQPAAVGSSLPQGVAMVVPTVGVMSPINVNLNNLQNVLKVAMDGNVLSQVLGTANGVVMQGKQGIVVQQPQQQIISLPAFVDHDGTTKIIINYSISPASATAATTQTAPLIVKNLPPLPSVTTAAAPTPSKTDRASTPEAADLSLVKTEPESPPITEVKSEEDVTETEIGAPRPADAEKAQTPKANSTNTCLLCDECPDHLEALHLLQHRKAANGEAVDSAALDPSFAALLSEAGVMLEEPPVDDLLSLLRTYFASNSNPSSQELEKISKSVSIPADVVRKWFDKMNSGKKSSRSPHDTKKTKASKANGETGGEEDSQSPASAKASSESGSASPSDSLPQSLNPCDLVIVKSEPEDPDAPDSQAEPLDLSLPKHLAALAKSLPSAKQQEQPLNLTCLKKEQLEGRTIYVTAPQTGRPINIVTAAQLPTLVAIASQGAVGCLGTVNSSAKRTILIPQLTYTYSTTSGGASGAKTVVLNGHKVGAVHRTLIALASLSHDRLPLATVWDARL